jgi:hypothetical protein
MNFFMPASRGWTDVGVLGGELLAAARAARLEQHRPPLGRGPGRADRPALEVLAVVMDAGDLGRIGERRVFLVG